MLAGQTASPSSLASDSSPALPDAPVSPGRRRGLTQLYAQLINHNQHPAASRSDSTHRRRPRSSRSRSSTQPDSSSSDAGPSLRALVEDHSHSRAPATRRTRRAASSGGSSMSRPLMLPIINGPNPDGPNAGINTLTTLGTSLTLSGTASRTDSPQAGSHAPLPSIQFVPASDPTRARPSLDFRRITRVLPHPSAIIRVGRYSERDSNSGSNPQRPSDAPIGFKSKVVSRRHCEFFYSNGQWYVKDVKSSSGTFLNHIRLSQPGLESRPYPVNDGDTVQLGIDFKGGEEMIFRCVKIRVEINRGWQHGLNKFNKSTHKRLQQLAKGQQKDGDAASKYSTDCTICLNSIAPCQALFVAPCSHTWHYKCIRKILDEATSSQFLCPNCRAHADLDADVEEEELEDFEDYAEDPDLEMNDADNVDQPADQDQMQDVPDDDEQALAGGSFAESAPSPASDLASHLHDSVPNLNTPFLSPRHNDPQLASLDDTINLAGRNDPKDNVQNIISNLNATSSSSRVLSPSFSLSSPQPISSANPNGMDITRGRTDTTATASDFSDALSDFQSIGASSPSRGMNPIEGLVREGPMTPRNTAGPFVFDGGADNSADQSPTHARLPS